MLQDIGKSILESYSRALESLAFNIVARIDDVLYVDGLSKNSDQFSSISHEMVAAPCSVPSSSTLDAITRSNASFLPSPLIRPMPGERSPFFSRKAHGSSSGVKKVLTDSSTGELKASNNSNIMEVSAPVLVKSHEDMTPWTSLNSIACYCFWWGSERFVDSLNSIEHHSIVADVMVSFYV